MWLRLGSITLYLVTVSSVHCLMPCRVNSSYTSRKDKFKRNNYRVGIEVYVPKTLD